MARFFFLFSFFLLYFHSSPAESALSKPVAWAKIVKAGNNYVVVLSTRTLWLIRHEDASRFSQWISSATAERPPSFKVMATQDSKSPYKIIDLQSGSEYLLQKPSPPNDVWYLNLEDLRFYNLVGFIEDGVVIDSTDPYKKERLFWVLDNKDPNAFERWRPGDSIITGTVTVNSYQGEKAPAGYLLFRFETQENFIHWLSDKTNQDMGLWMHPRGTNPNQQTFPKPSSS